MALIVLAVLVGLVLGLAVLALALRDGMSGRARARCEDWQAEQVAIWTEASLRRSRDVLRGQMVEQLVPLFDEFTFAEMADARFLGKPVDFIVFDGYTEARAGLIDGLREIVFIDIKTGKSRLSAVERAVRSCVEEGRVRSVTIERGASRPR